MEVSGQLNAPAALPPGKDPRYPLNRRLAGLQNQFGHFEEEKNLVSLRAFEPSDRPALGLMAILKFCYAAILCT